MSERFNQLTAHHSNLRARCAIQRQQLGATADEIERHLGGIDRGVRFVRRVLRNPGIIIAAAALIAVLGPKRLLGWASRGAVLYSTVKRLRRAAR
jgi:YqjK-like protein